MARTRVAAPKPAFLRSVSLRRDTVTDFGAYPFSLPVVRNLDALPLHPKVTFLAGENGSGKSTLIEGIAVAAGFNAEGGTRNFHFATRSSESPLHRHLRLVRNARKPRDGFFLRAESFYNVASAIEEYGAAGSYGGTSLHEMSHGESFLALANNRFGGDSLFILDEPEAALSPERQLSFLAIIDDLVQRRGGQMLIATHSPILLAYPDALIYWLSADGIAPIAYEVTQHHWLTRDFLNHRERYFERLFGGAAPTEPGSRRPAR